MRENFKLYLSMWINRGAVFSEKMLHKHQSYCVQVKSNFDLASSLVCHDAHVVRK